MIKLLCATIANMKTRKEIQAVLLDLGYGLQMANAIMANRRGISWEALVELEERYGVTASRFKKMIDALPKHERRKRNVER